MAADTPGSGTNGDHATHRDADADLSHAASTDAVPRHGLTILALCFAAGIAIGDAQLWPGASPALFVAAFFLLLGVLAARHAPILLPGLLGGAMVGLGAAWVVLQHHRLAADDLAAWVGESSDLVHLDGVALASPTVRQRLGGSLASFDYRDPSAFFPMRVEAVLDRDLHRTPVRGRVLVRVDETLPPFRSGDRVRVMGHLIPFDGPRNPGEFDVRAYARSLGQAGIVNAPSRELVTITPRDRPQVIESWLAWRESMQRRAGGWLLSDLPNAANPERDAFLTALLLGHREPALDGLNDAFQRVGIAHFLAISGLHLGIVVGLVVLVARSGGLRRPTQGALVILLVLVYLLVVEVRLPVLRAGIMMIAAATGLVFNRRLRVSGLIALSGIALLLWRPDQLMTPGFQLSFGVVLGLLHFTPTLRRRWFGPRRDRAASSAQMLGEWLQSAATVSIIAWLIASPIIAYHFGIITPLGIVLSIVAMLPITLLLVAGYLKVALAALLPSAALLLGIPLAVTAEAMVTLVYAVDTLPASVLHVPFPSALWTAATLAVIAIWASPDHPLRGGRSWLIGAILVAWLLVPLAPIGGTPALRIDMLSVGDGSCFVLRSGGETIVFDAGSNTSLDAGRQWIVPAMRRLGVRSIDAVLISHPDIDHYSAALEIVDAFAVDRVIVTPQFLDRVESEPHGPAAFLAQGMTNRVIRLEPVQAGASLRLGEAELTWLHPMPVDGNGESGRGNRDNDDSMVIRIDVSGRTALLSGDVEREGLARLLPRETPLRADIVELPHHGSYNDLASALIEQLQPQVVMQSTGRTRWLNDRWGDELRGIERLVTERDGACTVEIVHDGAIRTERFRRP